MSKLEMLNQLSDLLLSVFRVFNWYRRWFGSDENVTILNKADGDAADLIQKLMHKEIALGFGKLLGNSHSEVSFRSLSNLVSGDEKTHILSRSLAWRDQLSGTLQYRNKMVAHKQYDFHECVVESPSDQKSVLDEMSSLLNKLQASWIGSENWHSTIMHDNPQILLDRLQLLYDCWDENNSDLWSI